MTLFGVETPHRSHSSTRRQVARQRIDCAHRRGDSLPSLYAWDDRACITAPETRMKYCPCARYEMRLHEEAKRTETKVYFYRSRNDPWGQDNRIKRWEGVYSGPITERTGTGTIHCE